jgi:D-arabinose 1-dehydrogenase-like Zn-dependent alcohol dehydrogenase
MKIKAYAAFKEKSTLEEFEYDGELEASQIVLSIKYCSCTRGDIRFIDNHWKDSHYPLVPGGEIIVIVEKIGRGQRCNYR